MQDLYLLRRLIVILLALTVVYAFLLWYQPEKEKSAVTEQVVAITNYNVASIRAVAVRNSSGAYGLLAGAGGTVSLEPDSGNEKFSLAEMQGYIYLISKMSSVRVIAEYNSLVPFGFAEPEAVLTIIRDTAEKERFLLGKSSDEKGSHYLMRENGEQIYVVSAETARLFLRSREAFVERELIPHLEVADIDRLSSVRIISQKQRNRSYSVENRGGYHFMLTQPVQNRLSTERVFSQLIMPVVSLYPDSIAEITAAELPAESEYTLSIVIDDKEFDLDFYHKNADMYYVKNADDDIVFEIGAEKIAFLDADYIELLSGAIYSCNVSIIDSVIFDDIDMHKNSVLYISGAGEQLKGEIAGREVLYVELMKFMNELNSISFSEEAESLPVDLAEPYYTITVIKKDGSRDFLEFLPAGKKQSYLRVNGVVNFKVFDKVLTDIRNDLEEISEIK